jgi:hypothetical protein
VVLVREVVASVGGPVRAEAVDDRLAQVVLTLRPGEHRDDIADLRARLDDSERSAKALPHREKYLLLAGAFLRGLLDLHEQLVDDVERSLMPATGNGVDVRTPGA